MNLRLSLSVALITTALLVASVTASGSPGGVAPAATPMPTWTPPPAHWQGTLVDAGGGVYTDTAGSVWQADQAFSGDWGFFGLGGGPWTDQTSEDIQATGDDGLFRTQRYWAPGTSGGYRFAVPNGAYEVALRFAEICPDCLPGDRIFDVLIEDVTVAGNLDILGQYGLRVAVELIFRAEVTDGRADITFVSKNTRSGAALDGMRFGPGVNAIRLTTLPATPTPTATSTATPADTPTATPSTTPTATPTPVLYRLRLPVIVLGM